MMLITCHGCYLIDRNFCFRRVQMSIPILPGVVSWVDILTLAARDAVVVTGGPFWKVPTRCKDGTVSNLTKALNNIPAPSFNFNTLQSSFSRKGLDIKDLVLLSGGHSIGVDHYPGFSNRLYNFTGRGNEDPSLDSEYVANLRKNKCKKSDGALFERRGTSTVYCERVLQKVQM